MQLKEIQYFPLFINPYVKIKNKIAEKTEIKKDDYQKYIEEIDQYCIDIMQQIKSQKLSESILKEINKKLKEYNLKIKLIENKILLLTDENWKFTIQIDSLRKDLFENYGFEWVCNSKFFFYLGYVILK